MPAGKKQKKFEGIVYLVGAGPGDPGLLTLRGALLLKEADVLIYDGLVNPRILEWTGPAEKIFAEKKIHPKTGSDFIQQDQINRLLVRHARAGKKVVRLKGGDPFVFGRGGEEALYLRRHKIRFEIVPGVSAASSVPAYAGIPITDRRYASMVTLVTANEDPAKGASSVDWRKLADLPGTLVLFMGVRSLASVARKMILAGKPARTRVSVIEWGTLPRQRVVAGSLAEIARKIEQRRIKSPALTVIGDVNRFREKIDWFQKKHSGPSGKKLPLRGKTVLITRASSQAGSLREALERYGAEVFEYPAIRIEPPLDWGPLDQALESLPQFDWVIFTSTNGVDAFFKRLSSQGKDSRAFGALKIAAIGDATRKALAEQGIRADLVPPAYTTESLLEALEEKYEIRNRNFLLPRTDIAPELLRRRLEEAGARITQVIAYRTLAGFSGSGQHSKPVWRNGIKPDYITFTSSSTVRHFFDSIPKKKWNHIQSKLISIGPVTTETLKEYGFRPYREAREHNIPGLVKAVVSR